MKTNIVHNVRYSIFQCKRGSGATLYQSKYPLAHKESYAFGSFGSPLKSYTSQVYSIYTQISILLFFLANRVAVLKISAMLLNLRVLFHIFMGKTRVVHE